MLNGRVYGSKRDPNANPFANVRDEEPEFVEWGYGGMGSVKGAKSAGVSGAGWEKLGGDPDDDLEDATGMAWLRKRREAREQKAKEEQEAKEKAEKEAEAAAADGDVEKASDEANGSGEPGETRPELHSTLSAAPTVATITESSQATPTASFADITTPVPETPTQPTTPTIRPVSPAREAASQTGNTSTVLGEDHIFTTMAIPMARPHHHRARSASNATSTHGLDHEARLQSIDTTQRGSDSESDTETSSESDPEEEDDDDDDDDDEEKEEAQRRKMVIGAGMEKVSRHRDEKGV